MVNKKMSGLKLPTDLHLFSTTVILLTIPCRQKIQNFSQNHYLDRTKHPNTNSYKPTQDSGLVHPHLISSASWQNCRIILIENQSWNEQFDVLVMFERFGFGLKREVRSSVLMFGERLRTIRGHKTPHFLPNLTGLLETIL